MLHEMKLKSEEFYNVIYNNKIMEVRLNDDKRKAINIGDKIVFYKFPEMDEFVTVTVEEIHHFSDFKKLYSEFPSSWFGYNNLDIDAKLNKIYSIYSHEQEMKNGVIAIKFNVENYNVKKFLK